MREGLAADGALDGRLDVGRAHPPILALVAIDFELQVRLPHDMEDAHVLDALDLLSVVGIAFFESVFQLFGKPLKLLQVRPDDLDRVVSLDAGEAFRDVIADVLREIPIDPRQVAMQEFAHGLHQFLLATAAQPVSPACGRFLGRPPPLRDKRPARPLFFRFKGNRKLHIVIAGRIGAVIRPTDLRLHQFHFGELAHELAAAAGDGRSFVQRYVDR